MLIGGAKIGSSGRSTSMSKTWREQGRRRRRRQRKTFDTIQSKTRTQIETTRTETSRKFGFCVLGLSLVADLASVRRVPQSISAESRTGQAKTKEAADGHVGKGTATRDYRFQQLEREYRRMAAGRGASADSSARARRRADVACAFVFVIACVVRSFVRVSRRNATIQFGTKYDRFNFGTCACSLHGRNAGLMIVTGVFCGGMRRNT